MLRFEFYSAITILRSQKESFPILLAIHRTHELWALLYFPANDVWQDAHSPTGPRHWNIDKGDPSKSEVAYALHRFKFMAEVQSSTLEDRQG